MIKTFIAYLRKTFNVKYNLSVPSSRIFYKDDSYKNKTQSMPTNKVRANNQHQK
jgi:hypothetical protein